MVRVLGIGTATIAAYREPDEGLTCQEINPEVLAIAKDRKLFTYLSRLQGCGLRGGLWRPAAPEGGAGRRLRPTCAQRVQLAGRATTPAHGGALRPLRRMLAPGGALAVHISNGYLDLEQVIAASADHRGWTSSISRRPRSSRTGRC